MKLTKKERADQAEHLRRLRMELRNARARKARAVYGSTKYDIERDEVIYCERTIKAFCGVKP